MEYIKHLFCVGLKTQTTRNFSMNDESFSMNDENLLYPYKDIVVSIHEVHICPFCGEVIQGFKCSCDDFNLSVEKLQESCGDDKYKSSFHFPGFNLIPEIFVPISKTKAKILKKKEILALGPDFWDGATYYSDARFDKPYLVTLEKSKVGDLFLICNDVHSGRTFSLEMPKLDYKNRTIYLGIHEKRAISRRNLRITGSHCIVYFWRNLKKFEDWNDVCKTLKNL